MVLVGDRTEKETNGETKELSKHVLREESKRTRGYQSSPPYKA